MKIIVPYLQKSIPTRLNFLDEFELTPHIVYSSNYDPSIYFWMNDREHVFIYMDSELNVFEDECDAREWVRDNDHEIIFADIEITALKAVLTIS